LRRYSALGCNIVVGDLFVTNLPQSITRSILREHLGAVTAIRGKLYFHNNAHITALDAFNNLVEVGGVSLKNNPSLADARMASLQTIQGDVDVVGCDRLCPARYPLLGSSPSSAGCTNVTMQFILSLTGPTSVEFSTLASVLSRVVANVAGESSVSFHEISFLSLIRSRM
jgi:hypothetical protein